MTLRLHRHYGRYIVVLAMAGLLFNSGCSSTGSSDTGNAPVEDENGVVQFSPSAKSGVPQPGQAMFLSPEEAAGAFKDAVSAGDRRTLVSIFGSEGRALIFSGDRVQEDNDMRDLSARMSEYLHVDRTSETTAVLRVGQENWPFPIPVVKSADGWFFDTVAGKDELLNRRIGEDELNAISICRAYVAAQKEYARKDRMGEGVIQYAQHIMSRPGTKDGLFWDVAPGEELSPFGPLVAEARGEDYPATQPTGSTPADKPHPYKGYIFHILKAQGAAAPGGAVDYVVDGKMTKGFAMMASPSAYGASGIMTFIVDKDGKVYQKNLGQSTRDVVKGITEYNPDSGWEEVKD